MLVCKVDLVGVGVKDWLFVCGFGFRIVVVWLRFVAACFGFCLLVCVSFWFFGWCCWVFGIAMV